MLKLIVSDLDGTLLDSTHREISLENAAALKAAQESGVEIAIATGRTYGNALAICQRAGLAPHIISNNGAFVYAKDGRCLKSIGLPTLQLGAALKWLQANNYYYSIATDKTTYMPVNAHSLLCSDFDSAVNKVEMEVTKEKLYEMLDRIMVADGVLLVDDLVDLLNEELTVGNVTAITFDADKLQRGRSYFNAYEGMAMTVAGRNLFEMVHPDVSKGNALEYLLQYLGVFLPEVMAVGDNYNDISMLERVGISVAIGNAEPAVKEVCKYVARSNDDNGVACIIKQMLAG